MGIYIGGSTSNALKCNSSTKFILLLSTFQLNHSNKIWDFILLSNAKMQYSKFGFTNEINFKFVCVFFLVEWNEKLFSFTTFSHRYQLINAKLWWKMWFEGDRWLIECEGGKRIESCLPHDFIGMNWILRWIIQFRSSCVSLLSLVHRNQFRIHNPPKRKIKSMHQNLFSPHPQLYLCRK